MEVVTTAGAAAITEKSGGQPAAAAVVTPISAWRGGWRRRRLSIVKLDGERHRF